MFKVRILLIAALSLFVVMFVPNVHALYRNISGPLNVREYFTPDVIHEFEYISACFLQNHCLTADEKRAFEELSDRRCVVSLSVDDLSRSVVWRIHAGSRNCLNCRVEFTEKHCPYVHQSARVGWMLEGEEQNPSVLLDILTRRYVRSKNILCVVIGLLLVTICIRFDFVDRLPIRMFVVVLLWMLMIGLVPFMVISWGISLSELSMHYHPRVERLGIRGSQILTFI